MQKFQKKQKTTLHQLLQKYDTIISRSDQDIGQTDLIKIHIAARPDAASVAVPNIPFGSQTP